MIRINYQIIEHFNCFGNDIGYAKYYNIGVKFQTSWDKDKVLLCYGGPCTIWITDKN